MISRRRFLVVALAAVLTTAGLVAAFRRRAFHDRLDREVAALLAARGADTAGTISESDLAGLPDPVQRWLRASGVVGTEIPSIVRITQVGEFRMGAGERWMPMTATQHYTTNPPGFLWRASMEMAPLVHVTGRDRYAQGTGDIEMRLASVIPVASTSGGNLNGGALLRYLNETMWFPAALLLPNVTWDAIDDASARATLTDAGQSVSAVFVFDDQGRLVNMTAERWNDSEHAVLPWETPISDWGDFEGLHIASSGTGVWKTGPDAYDYVRLRVTSVEYDPPDLAAE
jgi:hypothetical protein